MSLANKYPCSQTTYGSHTDLFEKAEEYTQVKVKVIPVFIQYIKLTSVYSFIQSFFQPVNDSYLFWRYCCLTNLTKRKKKEKKERINFKPNMSFVGRYIIFATCYYYLISTYSVFVLKSFKAAPHL